MNDLWNLFIAIVGAILGGIIAAPLVELIGRSESIRRIWRTPTSPAQAVPTERINDDELTGSLRLKSLARLFMFGITLALVLFESSLRFFRELIAPVPVQRTDTFWEMLQLRFEPHIFLTRLLPNERLVMDPVIPWITILTDHEFIIIPLAGVCAYLLWSTFEASEWSHSSSSRRRYFGTVIGRLGIAFYGWIGLEFIYWLFVRNDWLGAFNVTSSGLLVQYLIWVTTVALVLRTFFLRPSFQVGN